MFLQNLNFYIFHYAAVMEDLVAASTLECVTQVLAGALHYDISPRDVASYHGVLPLHERYLHINCTYLLLRWPIFKYEFQG